MSREQISLALDDLQYVLLPQGISEGRRTGLRVADLLISITADIGIVSYVDESVPEPSFINQHIAIVRFRPETVCSKFVAYLLAGEQSQRLFREGTDVGAKAGMSLGGVRAIQLAYPDIAEQKAIAAALSDIDDLLASLDALIAKKRDLKQAAMQQLLTGEMRLPGFRDKWQRLPLRQLCVKIQDGTHFSPKLGGSDHLYVTSKCIGKGNLDLTNAKRISRSEHLKIYSRCDVKFGDILLTKDGVNTGNAAINTVHNEISLLSSVAFLRFSPEWHDSRFFLHSILSQECQAKIKEQMSGNAITRLTLAKINALPFGVPSLNEQTAIATILSDMDSEITALEARRDKTRELKQGMMQELLSGRIRLL